MKLRILLIGLALLMAGSANADQRYEASIDGAQAADTCGGSTAQGTGTFFYDPGTNVLNYDITFGNNPSAFDDGQLQAGPDIVNHLHVGPPGVSGGVAVDLPLGSPKIGSDNTMTAQEATDLQAGLFYVNIHSGDCPGGEIRGQLIMVSPMPALPLWAFVAAGATLLALVALAWRRQAARG